MLEIQSTCFLHVRHLFDMGRGDWEDTSSACPRSKFAAKVLVKSLLMTSPENIIVNFLFGKGFGNFQMLSFNEGSYLCYLRKRSFNMVIFVSVVKVHKYHSS